MPLTDNIENRKSQLESLTMQTEIKEKQVKILTLSLLSRNLIYSIRFEDKRRGGPRSRKR